MACWATGAASGCWRVTLSRRLAMVRLTLIESTGTAFAMKREDAEAERGACRHVLSAPALCDNEPPCPNRAGATPLPRV